MGKYYSMSKLQLKARASDVLAHIRVTTGTNNIIDILEDKKRDYTYLHQMVKVCRDRSADFSNDAYNDINIQAL